MRLIKRNLLKVFKGFVQQLMKFFLNSQNNLVKLFGRKKGEMVLEAKLFNNKLNVSSVMCGLLLLRVPQVTSRLNKSFHTSFDFVSHSCIYVFNLFYYTPFPI